VSGGDSAAPIASVSVVPLQGVQTGCDVVSSCCAKPEAHAQPLEPAAAFASVQPPPPPCSARGAKRRQPRPAGAAAPAAAAAAAADDSASSSSSEARAERRG